MSSWAWAWLEVPYALLCCPHRYTKHAIPPIKTLVGGSDNLICQCAVPTWLQCMIEAHLISQPMIEHQHITIHVIRYDSTAIALVYTAVQKLTIFINQLHQQKKFDRQCTLTRLLYRPSLLQSHDGAMELGTHISALNIIIYLLWCFINTIQSPTDTEIHGIA